LNSTAAAKRNLSEQIWFLLGSMKFAVWILVLTAVLSLAALLIGEFLTPQSDAPGLIRFFQLYDPFRSWWFTILLALLATSLGVCIFKNGPLLIREAFGQKFIDNPNHLQSMAGYRRMDVPDGRAWLESHFNRLNLSIRRQELPDKTIYAGRSGGISRLGPLFNHSGMLLLIVGGLAINLTGVSSRISGSAGDRITLPEWDFTLQIDRFELLYHPISLNQWVELPNGMRGRVVELRGDSSRVELNPHPGMAASSWVLTDSLRNNFDILKDGVLTPYQGNVRSYITHATMVAEDKPLFTKNIEVNHPLRFRGYRFYQSSFEPGVAQVKVDTVYIRVADADLGEIDVALQPAGKPKALPWGNLSLAAGEFYPDFKLDRDMHPFSASGQFNNPAVQITMLENGAPLGRRWVFTRDFDLMRSDKIQLKMRIVDFTTGKAERVLSNVPFDSKTAGGGLSNETFDSTKVGGRLSNGTFDATAGYTTILDVRKERGRWLIWAGFLLATIGLTLSFVFVDRRAWAVVMKNPAGGDTVHAAAKSRRGDSRFRQQFMQLHTGTEEMEINK
jgi:cytochrome c biogenesis protein ResB